LLSLLSVDKNGLQVNIPLKWLVPLLYIWKILGLNYCLRWPVMTYFSYFSQSFQADGGSAL